MEEGREAGERTWLLMEEGRFYGMGFLPARQVIRNKEQLKELITPYMGNEFVRHFMLQHAELYPYRKMVWQ
jgi:DNA polymerase-3 subunit epsilon